MSDELLRRADAVTAPNAVVPVSMEATHALAALIRDLAAHVRELEAELHFKACLVHDLLPYQARAVNAETERDALAKEKL